MRHRVLAMVHLVAANPKASEDDLALGLRCLGYEPLQAELLVTFAPLGLARALIHRMQTETSFTISDHALVIRGDQHLKIPLMLVPEFVEAFRLGEETFTTGVIAREEFSQTVLFSVELKLINMALNAGESAAVVSPPVLLRLLDAFGFDEWFNEIELRTVALRKSPI